MSEIKQLSPVDALRNSILNMTSQFQAALPKHITPDKFVRVIMTAVTTNPKLVQADRSSFFAACLKAASDGLLPDGKEAALVPFNVKGGGVSINYIPMISGILKKIRNSGLVSSIGANLVFQNDKFSYYVDDKGPHFNHEPADPFGDAGDIRGVYAYATLQDGSSYFEPMSMKDIEAIKETSKSKDFGPWSGKFEGEMMKKTAIRRLAKRLPMSTDIEKTFEYDNDDYDLPKNNIQITQAPPQIQIEASKEVTQEKPQDKTKPSKLSKIVEDELNEEKSPDDII